MSAEGHLDAELADHVKRVIDANQYMTLGTADGAGHPWVSPVWFAFESYDSFHWISSPDAKHSRNIAARPEVAIAMFDSSVPVGGGEAVYMKGVATELAGAELHQGIQIFDRASCRDIGRGWDRDDVEEDALFRLYRATISEHWTLIRGSDPLRGSGVDRSERVLLR